MTARDSDIRRVSHDPRYRPYVQHQEIHVAPSTHATAPSLAQVQDPTYLYPPQSHLNDRSLSMPPYPGYENPPIYCVYPDVQDEEPLIAQSRLPRDAYITSHPRPEQDMSVYPGSAPAISLQRPQYAVEQRECRQKRLAFLQHVWKLIVYNIGNSLLGLVAASLLGSGLCMGISLIPVFLLGLLVLKLVHHIVYEFARLDVHLCNYLRPAGEKILLSTSPGQPYKERLMPRLRNFSPLSLMALIYFLTVKAAVAFASSISLSMTMSGLGFLLIGLFGHSEVAIDSPFGNGSVDMASHPLHYFSLLLAGMVIGVALLYLTAEVSCRATRFFCCEKQEYPSVVERDWERGLYHVSTSRNYGAVRRAAERSNFI